MNWKPGFAMLSAEIFASVRTQPERCASFPVVDQSAPPRPCEFAAGTAAIRQQKTHVRRIEGRFITGVYYQTP